MVNLEPFDGALPEVAPVEILPATTLFDDGIEVRLRTSTAGAEIHYTLDGSYPGKDSPRYEGPIRLEQTTRVTAAAYLDGWVPSPASHRTYSRVIGLMTET